MVLFVQRQLCFCNCQFERRVLGPNKIVRLRDANLALKGSGKTETHAMLGLKIEADSVKLYEDLAKKDQNPEMLQLYLRIANEEKKQHFNIMENICDFVMKPRYFLEWREFSNLHEL